MSERKERKGMDLKSILFIFCCRKKIGNFVASRIENDFAYCELGSMWNLNKNIPKGVLLHISQKKINFELSKNIIFIGCLSPHIHFSLPVHLLLCSSARCNLSRGRTMNSNVAQMFEFYTKKCVCSTVYECEKCK